jgi:hypothetical protein
MSRSLGAAVFVYGSLVALGAQRAAPSQLDELVKRVSAYVSTYGQDASALVATEKYVQAASGNLRSLSRSRTTVAEFAIVRASGSTGWIGFRDIVEVDGKPIIDHRDRLLTMLTTTPQTGDDAKRLTAESARFNIGPVTRDFNVPTTALFFFVPENINRFSFKLEPPDEGGDRRIAFRQTRTPTLIESHGNPVPIDGELFVNANGEVHRTIMLVHGYDEVRGVTMQIECKVDVRYAPLKDLGMWLPTVMTEEYHYVAAQGSDAIYIRTRAEYSNYRRFETSVRIR